MQINAPLSATFKADSMSSIQVCDPLTKERMQVAAAHVKETRGLEVHFRAIDVIVAQGSGKLKDIHVCMLHQSGKCRSGWRCNQIHVDRAYVTSRRQIFKGTTVLPKKKGSKVQPQVQAAVPVVRSPSISSSTPFSEGGSCASSSNGDNAEGGAGSTVAAVAAKLALAQVQTELGEMDEPTWVMSLIDDCE